MKLECTNEKLKNAVGVAERITGKNVALPALSSILLHVSGKSLKIRATNLSLGIEIEMPAKVESEGVVAVSGVLFNNLLSSFQGTGGVDIESVNDNIRITTKGSTALLKCVSSDEFPILPTVTGTSFTIPVQKFIEGLRNVIFSAAVSDIKPEISAIYIYQKDDSLTFVATDSFRLAEKKVKVKNLTDFPPLLIPVKNAADIMKVFQDKDEDVVITIADHQASFVCGPVYLTTRLIGGIFPDYTQIIPKNHTTEAVILKNDLSQALKVSNIFSGKFNQITLSINPTEKVFSLSSHNNDVGEQKSELAAALKGNPIDISLNYRYFSEVLGVIGADSISLETSEQNKPLVLRGVGETNFLYLMMPMNR